jgi:CheY-like chemotaxis protein
MEIAIIGLGYVGLPLAVAFAKKYRVRGFDIDSSRIADLQQGVDNTLEVDGNELVKNLRALPEVVDATYIAITGYGQQEDREQSLAAGFDYHFVKPVDPPRLLNVIATQKIH